MSSNIISPDISNADILKYVNNPEYSDVSFLVEGEKVYGNKIMLAQRSEYFKNLLFGNMRESTSRSSSGDEECKPIPQPDVSHKTFLHVLGYLYTGSIATISDDTTSSLEDYQNLLIASDKYQIDRLKQLCEQGIRRMITVETAATICLLAHRHHADALKRFAMDFMFLNWNNRGEKVDQVLKDSNLDILGQDPDLLRDIFGHAQSNYSMYPNMNLESGKNVFSDSDVFGVSE